MQRFPGAASLYEQLDCKVLAVLRDGTHLVGILRSFDQFSNLVLEGAVERRNVGNKVTDVPLGVFILRGENIVFLGSMNEAKEQSELEFVDIDQWKQLAGANKEKLEAAKAKDWNFY